MKSEHYCIIEQSVKKKKKNRTVILPVRNGMLTVGRTWVKSQAIIVNLGPNQLFKYFVMAKGVDFIYFTSITTQPRPECGGTSIPQVFYLQWMLSSVASYAAVTL
jgi:hypothetical protein